MKKIFLSISFLLITFITWAQQKEVAQLLTELNKAFQQKSATVLQPLLAANFEVSSYMGSAAVFSLQQVVKNYKLDDVLLEKISKEDSLIVVAVKLIGAKDSSTKLYLNKNYQLLRIDLCDNLYGMDRNIPAVKLATIPIEVDDSGSVFLLIKLNNSSRQLRFLFDTGADGMMIGTALADSLGLQITKEQKASVVGGNIDIKVSADNLVHLNGFELPHQSIAIFGDVNPHHDGIIGNTIVKKYITQINFDKKEMTLFSLGKFISKANAQRVSVSTATGNILLPAVLTMQNNQPVLGDFTFDTGAGFDLIVFRPSVLKYKMLVSGFVQDSVGSTISMGIATPVFHGKSKSLQFSSKWKIDKFSVTLMGASSAGKNWKPEATGSLGIKFISNYNLIINLVDKYIEFEERKKN